MKVAWARSSESVTVDDIYVDGLRYRLRIEMFLDPVQPQFVRTIDLHLYGMSEASGDRKAEQRITFGVAQQPVDRLILTGYVTAFVHAFETHERCLADARDVLMEWAAIFRERSALVKPKGEVTDED